jgi:2-polyprenyl-3-methyl-5-hydroxy-6-metoxy-1,4-benzoquinol methylase
MNLPSPFLAAPHTFSNMSPKYGTVEWLEEKYQGVNDDPWGLSWRGFERCRYDQTLQILDDAIARLPKSRSELGILDVGCSSGFFTRLLPGLGGQVAGIDLSETAVQRARLRHPNIHFKQGSVFDCAGNLETYDVVVCLEVIYYVEPSRQDDFLAAIDRILTPGGILLISSKTGSAPYFGTAELVELVSRHFKTSRVVLYGCEGLAASEGFFFGLWKKLHKVRKLVLTGSRDEPEKAGGFPASPDRRAILCKMIFFTEASPVGKKCFLMLAGGFIAAIKLGLRWAFPSKLANRLARSLNLSPTHTILVLTRKPEI